MLRRYDRTVLKSDLQVAIVDWLDNPMTKWYDPSLDRASKEHTLARLIERCKGLVASAMKDGIYEAAVAVLAEHGFEGLTMDRVAEAAGIAKGSLYNYFRNKQELVAFVFDKTTEPARQAVDQVLHQPLSAVAKLESILRVCFEHFATQRGMFDFLFKDPATRRLIDSSEGTGRAQMLGKFHAVLQQGVEQGVFRPVNLDRTAEFLLGAVISTIEQEMVLGQRRPVEQSVATLLDVFLHGLRPQGLNQHTEPRG